MAPSLVGFALMACFLGLGPQCRHWVEWHLTQKGHLAREGKFEGTGKGGRRGRAASPSAVSWWACFYYSLFCVYLGRKQLSEPLTALVEGSSEQELGAGDWGARINAVGPQASHSMSLPLSSWAVEVGDFKAPSFPRFLVCVRWAHDNLEFDFLVCDSLGIMSWKSAQSL